MADASQFQKMIIESVKLMAADYEIQIQQFPDFVHIPDEIALTFNECILFVEQVCNVGLINDSQIAELRKLDSIFDVLDRDAKNYTLDALESGSQWQEIRSISRDILESFGAKFEPPNLFWVSYHH